MYLLIDSSNPEQYLIAVDSTERGEWQEFPYPRPDYASPLAALANFFLANNLALSALSGIAVRVGVGSFTALRTAVTVANTLGFAWGIPVIAWESAAEKPLLAPRLQQARPGIYVSPAYSAPPRIGGS
ncbi:MAG: hypothetical protein HYV42_03850 [Candidatus Magasanikbacteria bacterium]|nr:hypothetical protein [Candidatus Magasanikbacteria bacterium]